MRKTVIVFAMALLLSVGLCLAGSGIIEIGSCEFDASESNGIKEGTGCITELAEGWESPSQGGYGGHRTEVGVVWEHDSFDVPNVDGRWAEVTIQGKKGVVPARIMIEYLSGLANDDFCVLVKAFKSSSPNQPYHYVSINCVDEEDVVDGEHLEWATMYLPAMVFHPGQDITIQFRATGNAWASQHIYGQVAIKTIVVDGKKGQVKVEKKD